jgi:DNA-binding transcriptional LysR family regulator
VISQDDLAALDGLQWLGSGHEASAVLGISQATVSRSSNRALQLFGLQLERENGEWQLIGDASFLQMERRVHQVARWMGHRPLRLEATYWSAPTLCAGLPPTWRLGRSNIVGVGRNLQLVRERIVDAWIAGLPDLPSPDDPDLAAIILSRMPVFFTCAPGHPLLQLERISLEDVAAFPSLGLPGGSYPLVEAALRRIGLWNDAVRMQRYRRERWEGRVETDLVVGYGTPLSLRVSGSQLCRLPLLLPIQSGDAVVVHRDALGHPILEGLLAHLRGQLQQLAREHPEITLEPWPQPC